MRVNSLSHLLATTVAVLLVWSTAFGQAKVGTTGAQFLELPFSAQSSAMGWVGVTLIDEQAALNNPGALGLFYSDRKANLSLLVPHELNTGIVLKNGSIGYRLLSKGNPNIGQLTVAVAYNRISLNTAWMPVRTYEQGTINGTGSEFQANDKAQYLSAGIAWEGGTRIGVGIGLMKIDEHYFNESADGWAANLGLIIERPFRLGKSDIGPSHYRLTPTFGLAFLNIGPDLKMIDDYYSLPKRLDLGFGFKLDRIREDISTISARVIMEQHLGLQPSEKKQSTHLGSEIGLYDALYFRIGQYDGDNRITTYGFGTNLGSLINTLVRWDIMGSDNSLSSLTEIIDISYSYGNLNYWLMGYNGYHQLSIALK